MPLKNLIQEDHIPVNKYELIVVGLAVPSVTFTELSGLEFELGVIELPDRTKATGGQRGTGEFTGMVPLHHTAEILAMDAWFEEGLDPVTSTYKKVGTLLFSRNTGGLGKTYSMIGMWCSKRKTPDLSFENDGEMAVNEYTIQVDDMLPV